MSILIYSDPNEPVTQAILKNQKKLKIKPFHLQHFLDRTEVFDELNKQKTKLNWYDPEIGEVTEKTKVINRILYLPEIWFDKFHAEDKTYAQQEFYAYFTFAFNSFKKITERPGLGSLAGGCYSLPHQWQIIEEQFKDVISVPEFYIGPLQFLPDSIKKRAIYTQLYNFYLWKMNDSASVKADSAFVIKKPKGEPILAFACQNDTFINPLENPSFKLDSSTKKKITAAVKKLNKMFGFFCSETLFFVDGERLTMGMIHNVPSGSATFEKFETILIDNIKDWLNG